MADERIVHQAGRLVTEEEIEHAREVVRLYPGLSRRELARTICEHWGWVTAAGGYKDRACLRLLERLEERGLLRLPPGHRPKGGRASATRIALTARTDPDCELSGRLSEFQPVGLEVVGGPLGAGKWEEYVERYHPLGFRLPFGCSLRYFITSPRGRLGCVLFTGASRAIGARDRWIGWSRLERQRNLAGIINNSRYLLLPWVRIRFLASHVLALVADRIADDWQTRWGYRPALMETFVDPATHRGVCYRAAGWHLLGQTTGRGLARPGRTYTTRPKLIFVRPLTEDFRTRLREGRWTLEDAR
ncbi:MAG: Druantia anti-phage system protein DruA [Dehalococcoidia bacterium]